MSTPPYRPQPIPYQGSKRLLANRILSTVSGLHYRRLYEPFAGSAAVTIAAAAMRVADTYLLSDTLDPLVVIWQRILKCPETLADAYSSLWSGQASDPDGHYDRIRSEFNTDGDPVKLLYLLARCVKNAPRFNRDGGFNQSADRRRRGMHPVKMRRELVAAASYLGGRTRACCLDFEEAIADATPQDLVYMDPPYEGTTTGPHKRYHQGLDRDRLERSLSDLNRRGVSFLLSYDGRCGAKTYGQPLPQELAVRIELNAGRSSQSTLLGRDEITVESLYVCTGLAHSARAAIGPMQLSLLDVA